MRKFYWILTTPFRRVNDWRKIEGHYRLTAFSELAKPGRKIRLTVADDSLGGFWSTAALNSGYREWRYGRVSVVGKPLS